MRKYIIAAIVAVVVIVAGVDFIRTHQSMTERSDRITESCEHRDIISNEECN